MHLILTSIKQKPINIILMAIVLCLYFLNNTVFKFCTRGIIQEFMICYFNDFICPLFFISYSNLLLLTVGREIKRLKWILIFGFVSALIWEFLAPVLKAGSVTDITDIICYMTGAVIYWFILRMFISRKDCMNDKATKCQQKL